MSCSTCRNFRQGVAARLGFCALDRSRQPLTGTEIRACWQPPVAAEPAAGLFAMVEALEAAQARDPATSEGPASSTSRSTRSAPPGSPAPTAATPAGNGTPGSWVTAEPSRSGRSLPFLSVRGTAASARPVAPEGRPIGRLVDAPAVAPALRLGSRGDARAMREAELARLQAAPAVDAVPDSLPALSANDEGRGVLERGTVR